MTLGKKINTWLQIIGVLAAGAWALYTFVYKEYFQPKAEPLHLNPIIEFTEVKEISSKKFSEKPPIAITLRVTIMNNSDKKVYNFNGLVSIFGCTYTGELLDAKDQYTKFANSRLQESDMVTEVIAKQVFSNESKIIALIPIKLHSIMFPKERAQDDYLLHIPKGTYDYLTAFIMLPSAADLSSDTIKYVLENGSPIIQIHTKDLEGNQKILSKEERKNWETLMTKEKHFKVNTSLTAICL